MSPITSDVSPSTSQDSPLTINHSPIIPLGSSPVYYYINLNKNYVRWALCFCACARDASAMRRSTSNIGKQTVSQSRSGSNESSIAHIHQVDGNLRSFRLIGRWFIAATSQRYSAPNVCQATRTVKPSVGALIC
jgi:hypothetical protein